MPTFSIVLPTCNRPEMLERAVRSVMTQTFRDFELLIVDDSGAEPEARNSHWAKLSNVHFIRNAGKSGAGAARNLGIQLATGAFISFLDDDDEYTPNFLQATYTELLRAPKTVGMSFSRATYVDYDRFSGQSIGTVTAAEIAEPNNADYVMGRFLSSGIGCGVTIRSSCLKEIGGFDESFMIAEDTDIFYTLVEAGYLPVALPEPEIIVHRHYEIRLSHARLNRRRIQECWRLVDKHRRFFSKRPEIRKSLIAHVRRLESSLVTAGIQAD